MNRMSKSVEVNIEDGIGFIRLNRPEKLNSLSGDLMDAFTQKLENLGQNEKVKVIIFSGEGKAFCAGGDLETMKNLSHSKTNWSISKSLRINKNHP